MQTAGLEVDAFLQVCFKIFLIINIRNITLSLLINSMFIFLERKSKISLFFCSHEQVAACFWAEYYSFYCTILNFTITPSVFLPWAVLRPEREG